MDLKEGRGKERKERDGRKHHGNKFLVMDLITVPLAEQFC